MSNEDSSYPKNHDGKPFALEARNLESDGRRYSPSIARNREAIAEVVCAHIDKNANVLEIASGTGEHGFHLTERMPDLSWTYSDIDLSSLQSQAAWRTAAEHERLSGPLTLDVTKPDWPAQVTVHVDTAFCANMIHIAPFEAAKGLIKGSGDLLPQSGRLVLYGPFARDRQIAPSNAEFSESLKRRDPNWGVRDLDLEIAPLAKAAGLSLHTVIDMPANNLTVIFQRI
ncbi:MAG: DUF938 domain-containing protein [Pseudomonadota bacterium]